LEETIEEIPLDIFSFCIMPNHWHFSVRSYQDGDIGKFFGKITQKVTQRWHVAHQSVGTGHLFQGRFKSFLVEQDSYFLQLMKYIEANPLRAKLVKSAEEWRWGSLYLRTHDFDRSQKLLASWPTGIPKNYLMDINKPISEQHLEMIRHSVVRANPLGNEAWSRGMTKKHNLGYTVRMPGRPKGEK
jgi:putative transposase